MDALEAVGIPELREALLFVRGRREPVSADDLAGVQHVHRNVARRRLDRLAAAGLLVTRSERRSGRTGPGAGRPARIYAASPETTGIEFPARHYEELVGLLVDALPQRSRSKRLHDVGLDLAAGLLRGAPIAPARDLRIGVERVCDAVGRLGFQASVEAVDEETAVIATPTCPLRPLVVKRPETADVDRGMWCGLIAGGLQDVRGADVSCETRDCLDDHASCRIVLKVDTRRD
jgi:predicted ArsR family transcriptional regulator